MSIWRQTYDLQVLSKAKIILFNFHLTNIVNPNLTGDFINTNIVPMQPRNPTTGTDLMFPLSPKLLIQSGLCFDCFEYSV